MLDHPRIYGSSVNKYIKEGIGARHLHLHYCQDHSLTGAELMYRGKKFRI